ncbi:MAG: NADH-quinone oxidoreductase subunit C [Elusimicrobia bacterium]|nr:NADH-quinone oxidoreductase subunit C [Elusimicrobiota bacterium]
MNKSELLNLIKVRFKYVKEFQRQDNVYQDDILHIDIPKEKILEICKYFKEDKSILFDYLSFITAVDYKEYFELVFYLFSFTYGHKIVIKVKVERDKPEVDSIIPIIAGANWFEREIYDLFGIKFNGHPDLTRILLPEDWEGYPLRKDYIHIQDKYD